MEPVNVLISRPYLQGVWPFTKPVVDRLRIMVDSGAFTYYHNGHVQSLEDYMGWLKTLPFEPWRYIQLDVIGNADATLTNLEKMLDAGMTPMPVFTRGAPLEHLERMFEVSDVVALAPVVGSNDVKAYMKYLMEQVVPRGKKVHWLGFTNHDFTCHYRPYSTDTSTWAAPARFGSMHVYVGGGEFNRFYRTKPASFNRRVQDRIGLSGVDYREFVHDGSWRRPISHNLRVTTSGWLCYMVDLRRHVGTELFMSTVASDDMRILVEQIRTGQW